MLQLRNYCLNLTLWSFCLGMAFCHPQQPCLDEHLGLAPSSPSAVDETLERGPDSKKDILTQMVRGQRDILRLQLRNIQILENMYM